MEIGTSEKSGPGQLKRELQLLFHALCDGLRQEGRQRRNLAYLIPGHDFSLDTEREVGIASSLAWHLRLAGFVVQLDAYFAGGSPKRRPDFGIWLPASEEYIYLELKMTAWGYYTKQYYYGGALQDIKKLNDENHPKNQRNGLIALGFSKEKEPPDKLLEGFKKNLSQRIIDDYPNYEEIGLKCVDLPEMDKQSSNAVIGLWFRKSA